MAVVVLATFMLRRPTAVGIPALTGVIAVLVSNRGADPRYACDASLAVSGRCSVCWRWRGLVGLVTLCSYFETCGVPTPLFPSLHSASMTQWTIVVAGVAVLVGIVTVYVMNPMNNPRLCTVVQLVLQATGTCTSDTG